MNMLYREDALVGVYLSRWYLDFQSFKGARFPEAEQAKVEDYRKLLRTAFSGLDFRP